MEKLEIEKAKKAAAAAAIQEIEEGMLIGLGSGSTTAFFIDFLAKKCQEGLHIQAVASSLQSMHRAKQAKIPLMNPDEVTILDLTVDGADEIDPQNNMIKGGGGALLREKLLAISSNKMIVIVDESKLVESLGKFPLAVEISPFAYKTTIHRLENQGFKGKMRLNQQQKKILTDNGNYIFDLTFDLLISNPPLIHQKLKQISGVIETGLFFNLATKVIIGYQDGSIKIR